MRFLPSLDLYEIDRDEADYILNGLKNMGYLWLRDGTGGHHNLFDKSGDVCVGEMMNNKFYVDARVHNDLINLTYRSGGGNCAL